MDRTRRRGGTGRFATAGTLALLVMSSYLAGSALAGHMSDWTHDHSDRAIPDRPNGLAELNRMFGDRCIDRSNDGRSYWPHQSLDGGDYVTYNTYIARNVGYNIRNHIDAAHRDGALYPGIGGYNCRQMSGSTLWSTHAWGAAIDTNWLRNPWGQDHWNGRGWDGTDYDTYIPDVWRGTFPGHRFYWGLHFSTPDPMHFQYVTNY
ncbi:MAG: M15 family metallopeptidase [Actinobacteria bacterium]|nr:M15 family metallopeptidase [Actinomycetota bacterium]